MMDAAGGLSQSKHVRRPSETPNESLYGAITIRRLVNPSLVSSTYLSINAIEMPAGAGTPVHVHYKSEEAWAVLAGTGTLYVGGIGHDFQTDDVLYVPAAQPHQVVNRGATPLKYLAITAPPVDLVDDNVVLEPYEPSSVQS